MSSLRRSAWCLAPCVAFVAAGCVSDSPGASEPSPTDGITAISVTVPPERLTPFCQGMIDLSDELNRGDVDDRAALIIATYRELVAEVPDVIAADFRLVLEALEAGAPPPTDPPITTPVESAVVAAPDATSPSTPAAEGDAFFDEGYGPGRSPSERINEYVQFACRDTENNPGPPATQPLGDDLAGDDAEG